MGSLESVASDDTAPSTTRSIAGSPSRRLEEVFSMQEEELLERWAPAFSTTQTSEEESDEALRHHQPPQEADNPLNPRQILHLQRLQAMIGVEAHDPVVALRRQLMMDLPQAPREEDVRERIRVMEEAADRILEMVAEVRNWLEILPDLA